MSGPAVVVGYLFTTAALLGIAFGVILMFASGKAVDSTSQSTQAEVAAELRAAGVREAIVDAVLEGQPVESRVLDTREEQRAVRSAEARLSGSRAGSGVAGVLGFGFSMFVIVGSFVGGLIGYLLTMKKQVLQCNNCQAVVQAS